MLEHVLAQAVIMAGTHPGEPPVGEGEVAVGVQTRRDIQRVRRQVTLKHIVTSHMEDFVS